MDLLESVVTYHFVSEGFAEVGTVGGEKDRDTVDQVHVGKPQRH